MVRSRSTRALHVVRAVPTHFARSACCCRCPGYVPGLTGLASGLARLVLVRAGWTRGLHVAVARTLVPHGTVVASFLGFGGRLASAAEFARGLAGLVLVRAGWARYFFVVRTRMADWTRRACRACIWVSTIFASLSRWTCVAAQQSSVTTVFTRRTVDAQVVGLVLARGALYAVFEVSRPRFRRCAW